MGFTQSFTLDLLTNIHDFSYDQIKVALYTGDASIDDATTEYTTDNEIVGVGYTAGGENMYVSTGYPKLDPDRGAVRFEEVVWEAPSTFTYRKALVYNATKGNRSILVIDYGTDRGPLNSTHRLFTPLSSPPLILIGR